MVIPSAAVAVAANVAARSEPAARPEVPGPPTSAPLSSPTSPSVDVAAGSIVVPPVVPVIALVEPVQRRAVVVDHRCCGAQRLDEACGVQLRSGDHRP